MGQCGCGDFQAFAKLAGPEGYVYAIEMYTSCRGCDTPAGVVIHKFSEKEAEFWDVPHLPDLEMYGDEVSMVCAIPVVDRDHLKKRALEIAGNDELYGATGAIEDGIDDGLTDAVRRTFNDWMKSRRAAQGGEK